jgi:hypothetical protein
VCAFTDRVSRGFVGAIDGIAIKKRKPTKVETKNPMSVVSRLTVALIAVILKGVSRLTYNAIF